MKAVVFHDIDDIRLEDVAEPCLQKPTNAIVRLTTSAICGTDLYFICDSVGGIRPRTILGHEGVGTIEALDDEVHNLQIDSRVVIPSTIACGSCVYCRAGYYAQCDIINPGGSQAGTAFFGGPRANGDFHGLQAEKARIPYANIDLIRLLNSISDDQAILLSDIFPTGYFGAELAGVAPGNTAAVFGCDPAGQFAIAGALLLSAARILAIDRHPDRLHMTRQQGAKMIDFGCGDPVQVLYWPTAGISANRVTDVVGVDAEHNHGTATPAPHQEGAGWSLGNAPAQALEWAVQGLAKAGTLSIIDIYAEDSQQFPINLAMNRDLAIRIGNRHHRKCIPLLLKHVLSGRIDPAKTLVQVKLIDDVIEVFEAFGRRETNWIKVELVPQKRQVEGGEKRLDEHAVDELARRPTPESGARG